MKKDINRIVVAKIGKTIGFKGYLKLHILSDFNEQFNVKKVWETSFGELEVERFDSKKSLIKFKNFDNIENSKQLTNHLLYSTIEETRELCKLEKDEFFWFDIIGLNIIEQNNLLGIVKEIERIGNTDYLLIETSENLIKNGLPKTFMLPYIDQYIQNVDIENKQIIVNGGLDILEAS